MFLTRDTNIQATICIWLDVERKNLFLDSTGQWETDAEDKPIMELSIKEFKKVFVGKPPRKGFVQEIIILAMRKE